MFKRNTHICRGQHCRRLHRRDGREAEAMSVGDPMARDVDMGALISAPHLEKVLDYVQIGIAEGAKLATGGHRVHPQGFENGYFMEPTILTGCHDDMRIVREEIFGPVMAVLTFTDEAEAIRRANATDFGLGAGLMTQDLARGHRVAAQLESGNVWINTCLLYTSPSPRDRQKSRMPSSA